MMIDRTQHLFLDLQEHICGCLERMDGREKFSSERLETRGGGFSLPKILYGEGNIEKAAVNFTFSVGDSLPAAASDSRSHLAGKPFQALSVSVIVHPQNPFVPTTHMNLRFFLVEAEQPTWHFGGGYDLTPSYGFLDDAVDWHRGAHSAAGDLYQVMKEACDNYFFLPHRNEHRGIGGLFFDDLCMGNFDQTFSIVEQIGKSFIPSYETIFTRRNSIPYNGSNKAWQLYRRGRYAEFNLLVDRGTRYGLQSGRRVESVLASMPPKAAWVYNYDVKDKSPEQLLSDYFLKPRDWLTSTNELET